MRASDALRTITAVGALACALPAHATYINGAATGLTSPATTNQFTTPVLAPNTLVTNQFAGVTFSPNLYFESEGGFGVAGNDLGNFTFPTEPAYVNPLTITFSGAVDGAAFEMAADGTPYTFAAYDGSTLVDSGSSTITGSVAFYGFTDVLTSIVVTEFPTTNSATTGGPYYLFGDLEEGAAVATPEPATLALGGLGLLGLALTRRRRAN